MMPGFPEALLVILRAEGGYVNDPDDPGGATNFGVTQKVYDAYRIEKGHATRPVKGIPVDEVRGIYRTRYWDESKCGELAWPLSLVHFDGCVNHGVKAATVLLQRELGLLDDGIIGPKTMGAMHAVQEPTVVAESLIWRRLKFYVSIARMRERSLKFLPQWVMRMAHLRAGILDK